MCAMSMSATSRRCFASEPQALGSLFQGGRPASLRPLCLLPWGSLPPSPRDGSPEMGPVHCFCGRAAKEDVPKIAADAAPRRSNVDGRGRPARDHLGYQPLAFRPIPTGADAHSNSALIAIA
jgi:hypothetical protein